ncbi:MAG: glycosyltransferase [Candidatus Riflebacteria bacterium HGW-Riflebacteria-1]|jgi:glycosyltransferase involved in cell wall biosynthesis|nr:MAG: glycosyltransferase [Candidatus Riflebacteria bacterium HGW-Riflebacteria-1]
MSLEFSIRKIAQTRLLATFFFKAIPFRQKNIMNIAEIICLDKKYSTTRSLVRQIPTMESNSGDEFPTSLFMTPGEGRQGAGGLRTKGYFKRARPQKPLITVVTVVCNGETHLESAILSVINQTYDNIEYIIIDGASKDGTLELIRRYELTIDYWLSENDMGIYDAMNKAVTLATGDFIYFLGADDLLIAGAISKMVELIVEKMLSGTIYYGDVYMPGKHKLYDGEFTKYKLVKRNICHQSIFYPRSVFLKTRYNLCYSVLADYELNLRLIAFMNFVYLPVLVAYYNDTGVSSSHIDSCFVRDRLKIIKDNFGKYFFYICWFRRLLGSAKSRLMAPKR